MAANEEIEFVDDRERELFARALLNEQVRKFLSSEVGRYLHGRARADLIECQNKALECDPSGIWGWAGRRKLRALQLRANCARRFMSYLSDAITDGEQALSELDQYRNYNGG